MLSTSRSAELHLDLNEPASVERLLARLEPGCRILYSIPPVPDAPPLWPLIETVAGRVVYLSTTGIYGAQHDVNEFTEPAPRTERERLRAAEEAEVMRRGWSWLILRPAAIYGPDRGVHIAMRNGTHRLWGQGENFVSRIHADDLAAHAEAGLLGELTGAWPVADDEPCTAREIAEFCAGLHHLPMPPREELKGDDTRRADRRVDGRAIRRRLGIELQYPNYRVGIPATLNPPVPFPGES